MKLRYVHLEKGKAYEQKKPFFVVDQYHLSDGWHTLIVDDEPKDRKIGFHDKPSKDKKA